MFEDAFAVDEYGAREPFAVAGFEVTRDARPALRPDAYGFRVAANGTVLAYSGDSGP